VANLFAEVTDKLAADASAGELDDPLTCEADHVDGTFNVLERNKLLDWLKAEQPAGSNICRILSNARCLSEGVDVPALDAVLFLNPRNSVVDVVQSVGRVMRKAPGKEYGYVILPIGVPADMAPEEALSDNKKYKVVWQVLQALRAHDDRFNAMVNKIELNKAKDDKLQVIGVPDPGERSRDGEQTHQGQLALGWSDEWRDAIYAKIVTKVGDRRYWEDWAADIAKIADRHVSRIKALLDDPTLDVAGFFDTFHTGLKANLNDGISRENAVEMLAQHIITKPVFDALFEGYDFAAHNPVSLVMQDMLDVLDEQGIDKEAVAGAAVRHHRPGNRPPLGRVPEAIRGGPGPAGDATGEARVGRVRMGTGWRRELAPVDPGCQECTGLRPDPADQVVDELAFEPHACLELGADAVPHPHPGAVDGMRLAVQPCLGLSQGHLEASALPDDGTTPAGAVGQVLPGGGQEDGVHRREVLARAGKERVRELVEVLRCMRLHGHGAGRTAQSAGEDVLSLVDGDVERFLHGCSSPGGARGYRARAFGGGSPAISCRCARSTGAASDRPR